MDVRSHDFRNAIRAVLNASTQKAEGQAPFQLEKDLMSLFDNLPQGRSLSESKKLTACKKVLKNVRNVLKEDEEDPDHEFVHVVVAEILRLHLAPAHEQTQWNTRSVMITQLPECTVIQSADTLNEDLRQHGLPHASLSMFPLQTSLAFDNSRDSVYPFMKMASELFFSEDVDDRMLSDVTTDYCQFTCNKEPDLLYAFQRLTTSNLDVFQVEGGAWDENSTNHKRLLGLRYPEERDCGQAFVIALDIRFDRLRCGDRRVWVLYHPPTGTFFPNHEGKAFRTSANMRVDAMTGTSRKDDDNWGRWASKLTHYLFPRPKNAVTNKRVNHSRRVEIQSYVILRDKRGYKSKNDGDVSDMAGALVILKNGNDGWSKEGQSDPDANQSSFDSNSDTPEEHSHGRPSKDTAQQEPKNDATLSESDEDEEREAHETKRAIQSSSAGGGDSNVRDVVEVEEIQFKVLGKNEEVSDKDPFANKTKRKKRSTGNGRKTRRNTGTKRKRLVLTPTVRKRRNVRDSDSDYVESDQNCGEEYADDADYYKQYDDENSLSTQWETTYEGEGAESSESARETTYEGDGAEPSESAIVAACAKPVRCPAKLRREEWNRLRSRVEEWKTKKNSKNRHEL